MSIVAAVDLGGTKILAGVYHVLDDVDGSAPLAAGLPPAGPSPAGAAPVVPLLAPPVFTRRVDTRVSDGPEVIIDRMAELVEELAGLASEAQPPRTGERGLAAVGVCSPGPLDSRTGVIIHAPNLFWHHIPLADKLRARLGVPVAVDNDANLAALAEWTVRARERDLSDPEDWRGPARPDPLLYVTVSTGIGGGLVSGGRVFHGFRDAAGEIGHLTVVTPPGQPLPCNCGNEGCLETVASGTALGRLARARLGEGVSNSEVARRFAGGDPTATAVVGEVARWLGLGLASVAAVVDPEVIVVGGGVSALGPRYLGMVREEMAARLMPKAWEGLAPALEPARLGEEAGLAGAALLARGLLRPEM